MATLKDLMMRLMQIHILLMLHQKNRPGIVDLSLNPIIDANEIYSGAYGRVSITFFPYNNVSKGIGCSLNNIQKNKRW